MIDLSKTHVPPDHSLGFCFHYNPIQSSLNGSTANEVIEEYQNSQGPPLLTATQKGEKSMKAYSLILLADDQIS